jgi:hypothetical protein
MHDVARAFLRRKIATFTSRKLDLMNAVLFDKRLDPYAKAAFNALVYCLNADNGKCFPSDELIVEMIAGSRAAIKRARNKLRQYGYLDWRNTGRSNYYRFNYAAAAPMLIAVERMRIKRRERREMLLLEHEEARSEKPLQIGTI